MKVEPHHSWFLKPKWRWQGNGLHKALKQDLRNRQCRSSYVSIFCPLWFGWWIKTVDVVQRCKRKVSFQALDEEKLVYERSSSKNIYLNVAVNTLKKLRSKSSASPSPVTSTSPVGVSHTRYSGALYIHKQRRECSRCNIWCFLCFPRRGAGVSS